MRIPQWLPQYGLFALVLLVGLLASGTYWLTPYPKLLHWYLGLNNCFYRAESWPERFFTPAVKAKGNLLALVALVLCSAGLGILLYHWRRIPQPRQLALSLLPRLGRPDALYLLGLLGAASGLWWWGNSRVVPGTDEVFSALYCAPLPPFQTVAYYMLPNNHLLFNLLNGTLFGRSADLVHTGRLLSGLAYLATVASVYGWFRGLTGHRLLAAVVALVTALQFPLWGFSFQARGYALYALAHWGAFIGLFGYLRDRRGGWLLLNAVCCVVGYAAVPTFLFFHLAQLAFGVLYQWQQRALDWRFWRYQAGGLLTVYLFYLPALGFSGLAALTSNEYVQSTSPTIAGFLPAFSHDLHGFMQYCFSTIELGVPLSELLSLLPLLLLLARRNTAWFAYGLFYALLLAVAVGLMLGMRHSVNQRNLIGHCSLALALVPATLYWLLGQLPAHWRRPRWQLGGTVLVLLALGRQFVHASPVKNPENLYIFDNSRAYRAIITDLLTIRAGQRVAYSWESFYVYYAGQQRGLSGYLTCSPPLADYYIVLPNEELPPVAAPNYELLAKGAEFTLYRRK
jgi:hypothetical protein